MSTPLVVLAVILAILAFILIPMMYFKSGQQNEAHQPHTTQKKKHHKKTRK